MPLIQCPECSKEISDKAAACPKCGYPLQVEPETKRLLVQGNKIAAIKRYRELHPGAGLAEAKQAVEAMERGEAPTETGNESGGPTQEQGLSPGALVAIVLVLVFIVAVIWKLVFARR